MDTKKTANDDFTPFVWVNCRGGISFFDPFTFMAAQQRDTWCDIFIAYNGVSLTINSVESAESIQKKINDKIAEVVERNNMY